MGDTFQTIVDRDAGPLDAPRLARPVVEWLVAEGIVLAEAEVGWALPDHPAHPPGPNWRKAVADPRWGSPEGVVVYTEHHIFWSNWASEPATVTCPGCRLVTPTRDEAAPPRLSDAIDAWHRTGTADVECPACAESAPLSAWDWSDDHLVFAHLGFEFWGWPALSEEFRARVAELLGRHRTAFVRGKV